MILSATALDIARTWIGEHEQGGNNRGALPDRANDAVGAARGSAWCTSLGFLGFLLAAQKCGLRNPFPRTASSQQAARLIEPVTFSMNPSVGAWYILRHSPTTGHGGWVETCDGGNVLTELSGNTFADHGGRAGNCFARHTGQPEVTHGGELLGYWQLDLAAQHPPIVT